MSIVRSGFALVAGLALHVAIARYSGKLEKTFVLTLGIVQRKKNRQVYVTEILAQSFCSLSLLIDEQAQFDVLFNIISRGTPLLFP
jgi:hypothetical protein